ncbi:MAG: pyridoxal phosphate-dependent aminotransferase, partial [Oscillospiraceae bacterium]
MSFISQKSQAIPRSAIREMFGMQVGLDNIVSFAMGEPDFKTPQHIVDAEIASLKRGETHYTPNEGIMPLREAISDSYRARGLDYAPREILISPGAISALLLTAMVTLDIGDEVLVPDPGWANYMGLIMQVGAKPIPVRVLEKNGFMYDVNELRAAVTDRTKLILINSPSNPTGGVADAENLRQIADLAKEKNLFVLTDEI